MALTPAHQNDGITWVNCQSVGPTVKCGSIMQHFNRVRINDAYVTIGAGNDQPPAVNRPTNCQRHRIQAGDKQYEKAAQNVPVPGDDILEAMINLVGVVEATSQELHRQMMTKLTGKTLVLPGDPGFRL